MNPQIQKLIKENKLLVVANKLDLLKNVHEINQSKEEI